MMSIFQVLHYILFLGGAYGIYMEIKYIFFQRNQKELLFWNVFTNLALACLFALLKSYFYVFILALCAVYSFVRYNTLIKEERK